MQLRLVFAFFVTSFARSNVYAVHALTKPVVDVWNYGMGNQQATETTIRSRRLELILNITSYSTNKNYSQS